MAKFLKGNELNAELEKVFENAESQIILISPYIKLHDRYKSALLTKIENPNIEITILFGKNEDDFSKSMKQDDFDFFKQFPNIKIRYEKRLHAKYYANETKAILTSMNLYGFSQNNNIEAGVLMESSLKGTFTGENEMDNNSWEYFKIVLEQSELLFEQKPVFEKKNLLSSRKYVKSEIEVDKLSDFFKNVTYKKVYKKREAKTLKIESNSKIQNNFGFCIRTGKEIPFNVEKPMEYEAFKRWNKFKDADYTEKYCHFSGELSNGKTSVNKPILNKNWKRAKEEYNL
ncbi:phospholipase D family protein [Tenacibaculum ovolyticum]|uniref:phospholipase D family protein n=1 Tax=Tenacibaculum ovolyticum TaxID=104270 RepID=UPI003BAB96D2